MGSGYDFKCKKCKTEYSAMPGIGMMYPRVYQGIVEDIKNGKYGPEWQEIMNLPCPKCGTENTTSGLIMWD